MALTTRERIALVAAAGIGLAAGLGVFTFGYAKGASYLTNDPAACANCHVMSEHFAAWERGSHRAAATCNDCHTPHNFVGKYATKAQNGFWHSFYFTTGRYTDPLRITERNHRITEQACRYCHAEIVDAIDLAVPVQHAAQRSENDGDDRKSAHSDPQISCVRCHAYVGHWVR